MVLSVEKLVELYCKESLTLEEFEQQISSLPLQGSLEDLNLIYSIKLLISYFKTTESDLKKELTNMKFLRIE